MNNKQKQLKIELIKTAKTIRKKFKGLHNDRLAMEEQLEERYKPITTSLKSVLNAQTDVQKNYKSDNDDFDYDDEYEDKPSDSGTDYEDTIDYKYKTPVKESEFNPRKLSYSVKQESTKSRSSSTENTANLSKYFDSLLSKNNDTQYGIRKARGVLKIGNSAVRLNEKTISIGSETITHTEGLLNLLFFKKPVGYSKSDLKNYKKILLLTNAHRKRFNVDSPIRILKKSYKYNTIIKPLFQSGSGLQTEYMVSNSNPVDYSYWDDPNELIDRLRLLVSSSSAGHTGHNNEIISIIEELREAHIIE